MKENVMVSDGTYVYIAQANSVRKITIADGTDVTLAGTADKKFNSLTYGNSVLYGCDADGIYSIHVTTGVCTLVGRLRDLDSIMYTSTTTLSALRKNSLITVTIATGAEAYIIQDV